MLTALPVDFHPFVERWFVERFAAPSPPQVRGWQHIAAGRDTLVSAPTGSGKTLSAFLWSIDRLVRRAAAGTLEDRTCVVYVSPLKALGNDIQKNLQEPLQGIVQTAAASGVTLPEIRVAVRTGDTSPRDRARMMRRPPHILITTPESLYILLTARRSREALRHAEVVIVDEIHAMAQDKRGTHLALSLERLDALAGRRLQRIGLSATQRPLELVAALLVGSEARDCAVVDVGHRRHLELSIEVPDQELSAIATHELLGEVYDRIADQVRIHRTTLVFVNTRRQVERIARELGQRLGESRVAAHHGSMSRTARLTAEEKLKSGEVSVVVATASLELGIDIGHVDLVCHLGSPRALATLLQRVGRSGHGLGTVPRGILYPLTRDDLVQAAAGVRAVRQGGLDRLSIRENCLDILAQQVVATVASVTVQAENGEAVQPESGITEEDLWKLVRQAYPYRDLSREAFDEVLEVLSEGVATRKGRRSAFLHRDRVHGRLWARRGARLQAITNGGAIPDNADYDVVELPDESFVGKINEDFAIESMAGDVFQLGNRPWRIRRVSAGKVYVEDATGSHAGMPFWLGEAPARTAELSQAVCDLREETASRGAAAVPWLIDACGLPAAAAEQIAAYVSDTVKVLGCVPSQQRIVAERFFDEAGGMQLVLHTPFGGRLNRAWGLALRKRFCVSFDIELQAAATDDGVVISLVEQHSFPLESVFSYVRPATLEKDLVAAVLVSPMFTTRWRWNSARFLAVPRFQKGRKVPMAIQRMRAEDLLGAVFPEQIQCQDNRTGPVEPPDHPLVNETLDNCLHEAMDIEGLRRILEDIEAGRIQTMAVETPAPSPMSHEILNANPYAFLDDAPLEERRARAVTLRSSIPATADGLGLLSLEAIHEVQSQAWPQVRDLNELHDVLLGLGMLPLEAAGPWKPFADALIAEGRLTVARGAYVAAERLRLFRALFPEAAWSPPLEPPPPLKSESAEPSEEDAMRAFVHGWLDVLGPVTVPQLAQRSGLSEDRVTWGLLALESAGIAMQGRYTPGTESVEWCERGLLARIHRLTLGRLRQEIEPVTASDFMRFLLRWQHVQPGTQLHGPDGLLQVIGMLQGLELPAPAWEEKVLPARVARYDPADLDYLCLSGLVAWGRLSPVDEETRHLAPTRRSALGFLLRQDLPCYLDARPEPHGLSIAAGRVADFLQQAGASFLHDIATGLEMSKTWVEDALWELVAHGLATGDGVAGLRSLLRPGSQPSRFMPVGRWSVWRGAGEVPSSRDETLARQLLCRYGVVFRELLARESRLAPWRQLLQIYRRWEARGEIRGGRFVRTFIGEQYSLPEAVEALRSVRRHRTEDEVVSVAAGDPLNLIGIITPGNRISPYVNQAITYRNGIPTGAQELTPG